MIRWSRTTIAAVGALFLLLTAGHALAAADFASTNVPGVSPFPPPLESYGDADLTGVWDVLVNRVHQEPFNLWATLIFLAAVIHTFLTHRFIRWANVLEAKHEQRWHADATHTGLCPASMLARVLHFFGEVEVVFGIWVVPLFALMLWRVGRQPTLDYLNHHVSYSEPLFVVTIMAISSTRPVLHLAEQCLQFFARLGGGGPGAWWLAILNLGPLLGSLISEPAAMTISALLLGRQFYALKPSPRFAYATLGLLFTNISVGGVLTHYAAPPVLMVAGPWGWNTPFMFRHFGWIVLVGIVIANAGYYLAFRRELARLKPETEVAPAMPADAGAAPVPVWVTVVHLLFMAALVWWAHFPVFLIGVFLFYLAFFEVTAEYQSELQLRSPILVGFFLAGLVVHGGLQQWWIAPVLSRLKEVPLLLGAIGLTAFNDNAAITYLSTLVPGLADVMKFAVVAGAITGGGLTVIANAPNPAGQSILKQFFPDGISPLGLLIGALPATMVFALCFLLLG
ncbi:MAG: putative Na+/H+ antiporter [Limisphaerales bacterium]